MGPILSHFQADALLAARRRGATTLGVSLDLNRTKSEVSLSDAGVVLARGDVLAWPQIERIADSANACFAIEGGSATPIREFSETTNRACSLMPTEAAPTMLLGGFYMHRIRGTDPLRDTAAKLRAVSPVRGTVLDTATGLGYTAIAAAKTADRVVTIELDPAVLRLAASNPWSVELFENPRIERLTGDAAEVVEDLATSSFDLVVHDPPVLSLAGELYSGVFYEQLFRILRPGGRIFHYVGSLESASGARTGKGVARRLQDAGFAEVRVAAEGFGYTGRKPRP